MNSPDLRILFVTSFLPHGVSCGAQVRVLNIARQLKKIGELSIASISSVYPPAELEKTRAEFDVALVGREVLTPQSGLRDRFRFQFDPTFLNTHSVGVDEADRRHFAALVEKSDVVWVHTIRTANKFRIFQWPHSVLDVDDIQSQLQASYASAAKGLARFQRYRLSIAWRMREKLFAKRFDVLAVCSNVDRAAFANAPRLHVVPNGFERPAREPVRRFGPPAQFGFIGPIDFPPNRAGLEWFIANIWPLIKRGAPAARLRIVGKNYGVRLSSLGADIDDLGFVDDPHDEIATWSAMIVPIRVGGGTRIKIAEAFSRKCPVVSTYVGARGYDARNGMEFLLADSPADFAQACLRLASDESFARNMAELAWRQFISTWSWDAIGSSIRSAVESCRGRK